MFESELLLETKFDIAVTAKNYKKTKQVVYDQYKNNAQDIIDNINVDLELDALSYAISLLDDPLIRSNEYMLKSAINQLKEDRFYQVGRESVAIAEVEHSPEIIYEEDTEVVYDDNKKSIH